MSCDAINGASSSATSSRDTTSRDTIASAVLPLGVVPGDRRHLRRPRLWTRVVGLAALCVSGLCLSGCGLLHPPLISAVVYPIWRPASDSAQPTPIDRIVEQHGDTLRTVRVGVLANSHRGAWDSKVGNQVVDVRLDENFLFLQFLLQRNVFGTVRLVTGLDDPLVRSADLDYVISLSTECIYETHLDFFMYTFNWVLLGGGFLLGYPYLDSEAFYITEALFHDVKSSDRGGAGVDAKGRASIAGAGLAINHRQWFGENLYWRPEFYSARSLAPVFDQILFDFLLESGALAGGQGGP